MSPVKLWTALATARLEEARQVYCPSHVLAGVTCHRCRDTRPGPGLVTVKLGAVVRSWGVSCHGLFVDMFFLAAKAAL